MDHYTTDPHQKNYRQKYIMSKRIVPILLIILSLALSNYAYCQQQSFHNNANERLRLSPHQIHYIAAVIALVVLTSLALYLFRVERRISELEDTHS